jgi:hypothetical protein
MIFSTELEALQNAYSERRDGLDGEVGLGVKINIFTASFCEEDIPGSCFFIWLHPD